MDSFSFEGFVLDPSKCSKLSMEEKRELVYEVSQWSQGAPELLQSWSRQEILQILCAEMGKERKYTGLTKLKIIEQLLKVVSEKRSQGGENNIMTNLESSQSLSENGYQRGVKRPRKSDHPNQVKTEANNCLVDSVKSCKNSACRAKLRQEEAFCKRCSCCICQQYDDNKDPSLWLICSSDPPFEGNSCGFSCHLECALRHEKSGIPKDGKSRGLDGSFFCVSCGKVNDLLGCWRKQMTTARDTRRVDILCYRLSLSQKLLMGTLRYQKLHEIVNQAMEKLEADVGPLTGLPVKCARGIVNRLSSGQEVQRLCAFAVESLDSVLSNATFSRTLQSPPAPDPNILTPQVRFENVCPTSIFVVLGFKDQLSQDNIVPYSYTMWHRKFEDLGYPPKPTCTSFAPTNARFLLSGLTPATQYVLKVVFFEPTRELGSCEIRFQTSNDNEKAETSQSSNPSSVEDENTKDKSNDSNKVPNSDVQNLSPQDVDHVKDFNPSVPVMDANLPITPCKMETSKGDNLIRKSKPKAPQQNLENGEQQQQDGSSRGGEEGQDRDFGYYVKVVRWLECEGHVDASFRQKFLTWYSLRATAQEVRIVKVFVDTLMEDPASLAGQLVDTFSEVITSKKCSVVSSGLCLKLFH